MTQEPSTPSPQTPAAVVLRDVVKTYHDEGLELTAVDGMTLTIPNRRFAMIVGPSGSGKTTLLNLIGCIDTATRGLVQVCGVDVSTLSDRALTDFRAAKVAFIFQTFNLFAVLSAFENVEYPLLLLGVPARERQERALEVLESVGLKDFGKHRPNQLSGGQRQRVAIARALVKRPQLVLADEPTANLDSHTGAAVIDLMRKVQEEHHTTFVFSTHDPQLMSHAAETYLVRDGKLLEHRTADALPS